MTVSGSCDQKQLRVTSPFCLHIHCPICFQTQSIVFSLWVHPCNNSASYMKWSVWNQRQEPLIYRENSHCIKWITSQHAFQLPVGSSHITFDMQYIFDTLYCVCFAYSEISDILTGQMQSTAIIITVYEIWYCTGNISINVTRTAESESAVKWENMNPQSNRFLTIYSNPNRHNTLPYVHL